MTVPFSAALTGVPSGAAMLMPVPLLEAKLTMTLPDTGQRNLSAPDMAGSCSGIFGAGLTAGATVARGAGALDGAGRAALTALWAGGSGLVGPFISTRPASGTTD